MFTSGHRRMPGRSVHKTVNERSVRVLKNLLNPAGHGGRLSPVVIFHRNYENVFNFPGILVPTVVVSLRARVPTA